MSRTLATLALLIVIPSGSAAAGTRAADPQTTAPDRQAAAAPLVVFLGDSLTAGLGLAECQAYPARVAAELHREGIAVRIVNAGVSGDTSAGGLRRLDWVLAQRPAVLVVGLGGNDALRAQPVAGIEANLREIVRRARARGVRVLLLGMRIPPNYGPDYSASFAAIYPRIAREMEVPLVPFLLAGVGGDPRLNQADGIHPTALGQELVARNVVPALRSLLATLRQPAAAGR